MRISRVLFIVILLFISGCASNLSDDKTKLVSTEKVYLLSHNYRKLIKLYKEELKKDPNNEEFEFKIVRTYLRLNDSESARYYLDILIDKTKEPDVNLYYLDGLVYYQDSDFNSSKEALQKAIEIERYQGESSYLTEDITGEIYNLKGIVNASLGDFKTARQDFLKAKHYIYSDVKMVNNLSVLDMLDGDFEAAYQRLIPFYSDGEGDDQLKANLAICMAKLNKYNELKLLFNKKYDEQKIFDLYSYLQKLQIKDMNNFSVEE